MNGLFNLDWRNSYPLSRIDRITDGGTDKDGSRRHILKVKGEDGTSTISDHTYEQIMSHPLQMWPAQPGTKALHYWNEAAGPELGTTPVIAWALCFDGSVRIVTPQGVDVGHLWGEGQGFVEMPDGSIQAVGEYSDVVGFDDRDAYLAYEVGNQAQKQEHVAPAANKGLDA